MCQQVECHGHRGRRRCAKLTSSAKVKHILIGVERDARQEKVNAPLVVRSNLLVVDDVWSSVSGYPPRDMALQTENKKNLHFVTKSLIAGGECCSV